MENKRRVLVATINQIARSDATQLSRWLNRHQSVAAHSMPWEPAMKQEEHTKEVWTALRDRLDDLRLDLWAPEERSGSPGEAVGLGKQNWGKHSAWIQVLLHIREGLPNERHLFHKFTPHLISDADLLHIPDVITVMKIYASMKMNNNTLWYYLCKRLHKNKLEMLPRDYLAQVVAAVGTVGYDLRVAYKFWDKLDFQCQLYLSLMPADEVALVSHGFTSVERGTERFWAALRTRILEVGFDHPEHVAQWALNISHMCPQVEPFWRDYEHIVIKALPSLPPQEVAQLCGVYTSMSRGSERLLTAFENRISELCDPCIEDEEDVQAEAGDPYKALREVSPSPSCLALYAQLMGKFGRENPTTFATLEKAAISVMSGMNVKHLGLLVMGFAQCNAGSERFWKEAEYQMQVVCEFDVGHMDAVAVGLAAHGFAKMGRLTHSLWSMLDTAAPIAVEQALGRRPRNLTFWDGWNEGLSGIPAMRLAVRWLRHHGWMESPRPDIEVTPVSEWLVNWKKANTYWDKIGKINLESATRLYPTELIKVDRPIVDYGLQRKWRKQDVECSKVLMRTFLPKSQHLTAVGEVAKAAHKANRFDNELWRRLEFQAVQGMRMALLISADHLASLAESFGHAHRGNTEFWEELEARVVGISIREASLKESDRQKIGDLVSSPDLVVDNINVAYHREAFTFDQAVTIAYGFAASKAGTALLWDILEKILTREAEHMSHRTLVTYITALSLRPLTEHHEESWAFIDFFVVKNAQYFEMAICGDVAIALSAGRRGSRDAWKALAARIDNKVSTAQLILDNTEPLGMARDIYINFSTTCKVIHAFANSLQPLAYATVRYLCDQIVKAHLTALIPLQQADAKKPESAAENEDDEEEKTKTLEEEQAEILATRSLLGELSEVLGLVYGLCVMRYHDIKLITQLLHLSGTFIVKLGFTQPDTYTTKSGLSLENLGLEWREVNAIFNTLTIELPRVRRLLAAHDNQPDTTTHLSKEQPITLLANGEAVVEGWYIHNVRRMHDHASTVNSVFTDKAVQWLRSVSGKITQQNQEGLGITALTKHEKEGLLSAIQKHVGQSAELMCGYYDTSCHTWLDVVNLDQQLAVMIVQHFDESLQQAGLLRGFPLLLRRQLRSAGWTVVMVRKAEITSGISVGGSDMFHGVIDKHFQAAKGRTKEKNST